MDQSYDGDAMNWYYCPVVETVAEDYAGAAWAASGMGQCNSLDFRYSTSILHPRPRAKFPREKLT